MNIIAKAYQWYLWAAGAAITDEELEGLKGGGDKITYWYRRSKGRLGTWWWVAVILTMLLANFRLYFMIKARRWGWVSALVFFDTFSIWFIPHVVWGFW